MKVVLISGKAGSGKNTVANMMEEYLNDAGYDVLTIAFGDLVKFVAQKYFNWDGKKNEYGRYILQYIGTDVVKTQRPLFWIDFVSDILTLFEGEWDYVLVPDLRFKDELCEIKRRFGAVHLRVLRPNMVSSLTKEQQNHPSETSLDDVEADFYIENTGDLSDLVYPVMNFIKENLDNAYDEEAGNDE